MKQFILKDGFENDIHTYIYEPKEKPKGIVQIIHGASEHFARYGLFAEYLTDNGYIVVGNDILGHGLSTNTLDYVHFADRGGDSIAFESIVLVKDWIETTYPDLPKYILGHSMGSFLARLMVIEYPNDYKKAIFSGTAAPAKSLIFFGRALTAIIRLFRGPKYVSKLVQDIGIDSNQKRMRKDKIISGDNEEWLTRDKKIQEYYKHSPMCGQPFTVQANHDLFNWIRASNNLSKIKKSNKSQPLFFISGSHDPLGDYGNQIQKLVENMRITGFNSIDVKIYPEARHEILNEINKEEVYQDILNFLNR